MTQHLTVAAAEEVDVDGAAELLATACRVMAYTGLTPDVLGHISLRTRDGLLVRCRGPRERGLAFTTAEDLHELPLAGGEVAGDWSAPSELPIHTSVMQARPDVSAVVHAHPPAVVTTTVAGLDLQPIVGAYDIPASKLAAAGIPVWPRAALVNTPELGDSLARALGERPVAALYGHGLISVGRGDPETAVAEAVVNAVAVDGLAKMTLAVRAAGATPAPISAQDQAQLPDLGAGFTVHTMWRHLVAMSVAAVPGPRPR